MSDSQESGYSFWSQAFMVVLLGSLGVIIGILHQLNEKPQQMTPSSFAELQGEALVEGRASEEEGEATLFAMEGMAAEKAYFVFGEERGGNTWRSKRVGLEEATPGYELRINAAEINTWLRQALSQPTLDGDAPMMGILPGMPNFFIGGGKLHFSMQVDLLYFGNASEYRLIGRGEFSGNSDRMALRDVLIGSADLPHIPFMREVIVGRVFSAFASNEEGAAVAEALKAARTISVDGAELVIQF